jgi:dTDP-glucose 4,6-dehydratase
MTEPDLCASTPTKVIDTAYFGLRNIFEYAKRMSAKPVFLFISSAVVYGDPLRDDSISENGYSYMDPLTVRSIYGESKRICETMSLAYSIEYGLLVKIARFSNAFGPGMRLDKGSATADFLSSALQGKDIVIKSDGTTKREFLYFTDLVSGLFYILLCGGMMEACNIGGGLVHTVKEFAQTVQEIFREKNIAIKILGCKRLEDQGSPKSKRLNAARLEALGWRSHDIPLYEAVKRFKMSVED